MEPFDRGAAIVGVMTAAEGDSWAGPPRSPPGEDAEAIGESLRRPEAFTAVFEAHFDAVSSFVRRRVGADAADEIVSETFTRAFQQRSRYDRSYPSARPWLFGIASNLLRRHWRSESSRLAAYSRLAADPAITTEPSTQALPEMAELLNRLPAGQREVLLLHALAELTYEEIARALGIRVGTVRSRLSRARRAMRDGDPAGSSEIESSINVATEEGSNA